LIAALFVFVPLWRHSRNGSAIDKTGRVDINLSIFEERQAELEAELDSGNVDAAQFEGLLLELKRSLLSDAEDPQASGQQALSIRTGSLVIPVALFLVLASLSFVMYQQWGYNSDVKLMDYFERTIQNVDNQQVAAELALQLEQARSNDRDNPWIQYFLGRNYTLLGRIPDAESAFRSATELLPDGPDKASILGQLAQINYFTAGARFTEEVAALVDQARGINPAENASLQLLALDATRRDDLESAIGYWRLIIQSAPNSRQAAELRNSIAEAQTELAERRGEPVSDGPIINVQLSLAEGLELPSELRVFVAARNAEQEGLPPLAARDLTVSDLPATITLDNSAAVGMFNLSSAASVFVTATVSLTGSATVQAGDYRVASESFATEGDARDVSLVISNVVQ